MSVFLSEVLVDCGHTRHPLCAEILCSLLFSFSSCCCQCPTDNDSHHSWLRNQKGTLNKINLGPTSLFHSATWFGPAEPSSGKLVYIWKILAPASLLSWEHAVYKNFVPSMYLHPNGSIPVLLIPTLCTAGCIILNTIGTDVLCWSIN
jgi:hypothetical protein